MITFLAKRVEECQMFVNKTSTARDSPKSKSHVHHRGFSTATGNEAVLVVFFLS